MNLLRTLSVTLLFTPFVPLAFAQKSLPPTAFKPGQTFFYDVQVRSNRDIHTVSGVSIPQQPITGIVDVHGILQVEALPEDSARAPRARRFRTLFVSLVSDVSSRPRGTKPDTFLTQNERVRSDGKFVDCTIQPNGQITQTSGLDQLASEQQTAWREWAARFSTIYAAQYQSRKRGEKWNAESAEISPSPIAGLLWREKSQYVRDESCAPLKFAPGESSQVRSPQEPCAVLLTSATLIQKSSQQDSTPPDYKIKNLKTRGSAKGNNETTLYLSRKSGLLIRATQTAKQQMDVTIGLANGSNQVHYTISAQANSSVELLTELPFNPDTNP